jgi:hypothetical protein
MAKAGPDKKLCGAITKSKRGTCGCRAGARTVHLGYGRCSRHGGSTSSGIKAAQLEAATSLTKDLVLGDLTTMKPVDPFKAILQNISIVSREIEIYSLRISEIEANDILVRPVTVKHRPLDEGKEGENPGIEVEERTFAPIELNIWIKARHAAMDRRNRYSKDAISAGIAERLVRIEESQARLYYEAMRGILEDAKVTIDAAMLVNMRKRLTAIDSTAEEE